MLAHVRVIRSRLERAARGFERAQRAIAEFPDPGRLPAIAATVEHDLATARANAGTRHIVEEPSAAELAVLQSLATGLSRREIGDQLYISLNTVKTHTRELYRSCVQHRARTRSRARKRSACLIPTEITRVILRPHGPNCGHRQAC